MRDILKLPEGAIRNNIKIPLFANQWTKKQKGAYIAGVFDAEGYVSKRQAEISLTTTSPRIFDFALKYLKSIGLNPSFRIRKRRKNPEYEIRLYGKENLRRFSKWVPAKHPEKVARLMPFLR